MVIKSKRSIIQEDAPIIEIPTLPGYVLEHMREIIENILNGDLLLLGLDVGYGVTKALSWGFEPILFKTLYGYGRDLGYDTDKILKQNPGESIITEEGKWFVGKLASTHLAAREQLSLRGRDDANVVRRLMMLAAIGKMFPGLYRNDPIRVIVATGLPEGHMKGADRLKHELVGHWMVETDQSRFPVEIEYVSVMPQPTGTINAYSLLPNGAENPRFIFNKIAVVDNGKFSVDLSTEEAALHVEAQSGTSETGMHTAFERLANRYNTMFGEYPEDRTVESILLNDGKFKVYGEAQDWSAEVADDLKPMREATIALCREKIGRAAQHELILNVGGPAPLVKEQIKKEYRQAMMPDHSQTTNALGYLHYASFIASEL